MNNLKKFITSVTKESSYIIDKILNHPYISALERKVDLNKKNCLFSSMTVTVIEGVVTVVGNRGHVAIEGCDINHSLFDGSNTILA
jgi:putative transposon-encoded protein